MIVETNYLLLLILNLSQPVKAISTRVAPHVPRPLARKKRAQLPIASKKTQLEFTPIRVAMVSRLGRATGKSSRSSSSGSR
jgi:hypothetical protein